MPYIQDIISGILFFFFLTLKHALYYEEEPEMAKASECMKGRTWYTNIDNLPTIIITRK